MAAESGFAEHRSRRQRRPQTLGPSAPSNAPGTFSSGPATAAGSRAAGNFPPSVPASLRFPCAIPFRLAPPSASPLPSSNRIPVGCTPGNLPVPCSEGLRKFALSGQLLRRIPLQASASGSVSGYARKAPGLYFPCRVPLRGVQRKAQRRQSARKRLDSGRAPSFRILPRGPLTNEMLKHRPILRAMSERQPEP